MLGYATGKGVDVMIGFAALTYGMLMSFTFSALRNNEKRQQKNPLMMVAMGYVLVGATATISAALFGTALSRLM